MILSLSAGEAEGVMVRNRLVEPRGVTDKLKRIFGLSDVEPDVARIDSPRRI
jgi:hypothetical protein